jgi:hypothetical protein
MDNHDTKRQHLLLDTLVSQGAASPTQSTDQLLYPWQRLAAHLRPLIGESGFCALFVRSIRISVAQYEWLAASQPGTSIDSALRGLGAAFGAIDIVTARAANLALLNTFTRLLADLIGEALTFRIMDSAANGGDEQKNAQEHK